MTELGDRIRSARERKRWSQEQLAEKVGTSLRSVGNWERGVNHPRNSLGRLEEVLGVTLVGPGGDDAGFVAHPGPGAEPVPPDTARELLEEIRQMRREVEDIKRRLDGS
jgi:transcriptional regulator with XRE-family HTH domain